MSILNENRFKVLAEVLRREANIIIYDVKYIDGYEDKSSIMHFRIKGLKHWLFGAWLREPDETDKRNHIDYHISVFCQYDRFIDKFKPGRGNCDIDLHPYISNVGEDYMELYALINYINFMKKHEAMAFVYESDITAFRGETYAKIVMMRAIVGDMWIKWSTERLYKKLHRWSKIFSTFGFIKVIYCPDKINGKDRYNDDWFIYPCNAIGEKIANAMFKMQHARFNLGSVYIEAEDTLLWDAYTLGLHNKKYELKKTIVHEDGTLTVDDNELWATIMEMEADEDIIIYGKI